MNRTFGTLAIAAALAGSGVAGRSGNGEADGAEASSSAAAVAVVTAAAQEMDPQARLDTDTEREAAVSRFMGLVNELRELPALAPLFEEYQVAYPIELEDELHCAALVEMLGAVRITASPGAVFVVNRATGAVIFVAPPGDLEGGTVQPVSLPISAARLERLDPKIAQASVAVFRP
jgi:hypothetical protein